MDLLRRPDLRRLLIGQTVSGLGDWMGTFAFMALALSVSGSPAAVGGILALRLLPAAVGGSAAARIALSWDRKRTMVAMDLVRAGIVAVVPLVSGLWWIYLWALLLEATSIVFVSARDASIPDLVDAEDLPVANGMVLATSYGSIPFGAGLFALAASLPILEGGWFEGRDHALVFWVDALTFVVSAVLIQRMTGLRGRAGVDPGTPEPQVGGRLRDALAIPLVRSVLAPTAAAALGLGALFSLGIVLIRDELDASDSEFGALIAMFGVGAAGGLWLAQRLRGTEPLVVTRWGAAAMGLLVATMSLSPVLWLTYCGALGFGAAVTVALTAGMSALQTRVDESGRVVAFAAFHVVIRVGLGIAAVGAGLLGQAGGTRAVLLGSGMLTLVSASLVRSAGPVPARTVEDRA